MNMTAYSLINLLVISYFLYSKLNIMLDFLILAVFAFLIFRVITLIFSTIEGFFGFSRTPPTTTTSNAGKTQKPKEASPVSPYVAPSSSPEKSKVASYVPPKKPVAEMQKVNLYQEFMKQERVNRKMAEEKEEAVWLREELEEVKAQNERLCEEIERHKQQKAGYVGRIEEIIQHVMNSQAPPPQFSAEQQQADAQLKALGELTKQIDHAHQIEVQRLNEREQEVVERMHREQQIQQIEYLSQIQHISAQLKLKDDELTKRAEQLQEFQRQIQLNSKESEQGLQQELLIAHQEVERLSYELQNIRNANGSNGRQINPQAQTSQVSVEQYVQIKFALQQAKQEAEDQRKKFNKLRQQSSICENDKLEADIRLTAQVQSLQQLKTDMEAQIAQLNETLFREQQERNQLINQAKQQLTAKYEAEIESLGKSLEKEQESRKDAERKLAEIQNELQFVQVQLKSTLESERALTAQVEALRSPKKEKISLTDVQSHAEYQLLKRKVEQLQEINNVRTQNSQDKNVPAQRKINYARTKVERQASPTFQFQAKQRTPPKVETSSSRSKDVVSTIFASGVEKGRSPASQRYQTPMQKPVAQSSILEGGLLSEGFLGETNILDQSQREFLIGEIKTLKKIDVKKARLLYRSLGSNPRPLSQYTSNVPNVLVVVELSNKKLLGAFTQAAFTRELGSHPQRKYTPANKAMIMDISKQRIILNASASDTIRYDENALIWGRNEFAVSSEEPLLLSCDLNCQQAVYPCDVSSQEFLGSAGRSCPISQFQVYRIFLG